MPEQQRLSSYASIWFEYVAITLVSCDVILWCSVLYCVVQWGRSDGGRRTCLYSPSRSHRSNILSTIASSRGSVMMTSPGVAGADLALT
jgi:hypothetical protein